MKKYIQVYDDVLSKDQCNEIIEKFEQSSELHKRTVKPGHRYFTELNTSQSKDWQSVSTNIFSILRPQVERYRLDCNITHNQWPDNFGFEQMRIKKYEADGVDEFQQHVDVGDYTTARRFLVFFLYLKDNEGGETSFSEYDIKVKPKAGRLLMFPPTWTYLHTGHKPKLESKYIIGSYLHYL